MNADELKLKIFRQIDSLDKTRLEEFYGVLTNYVNGQKDISEWEKLSPIQKHGIINAINEITDGKGISHDDVITKYRDKYSNA